MLYYIFNMERLCNIQNLQQISVKSEWSESQIRPLVCQVLFTMDGRCKVNIAGEGFAACRDSLFFLPPGTPYSIGGDGAEAQLLRITFLPSAAADGNRICSFGECLEHLQYYAFAYIEERWAHVPLAVEPSVGMRYRSVIEQIYNSYYDVSPGSNLTAACCLHQLLARVSTDNAAVCLAKSSAETGKLPSVHAICDYLNSNYMQKISLTLLSEKFHLSPNYLCSLFKETTGFSITEYLNARRVEAAKQYLVTADCRVRDVARAVGVSDEFYFSRMFKRITGDTPTEFRKKFRPVKQ